MSLVKKLRRSSPTFDDLLTEVSPTMCRSSKIILRNRGIQLRSDQLRTVRRVVLDLALDDYDYSQNEAIRAGLDWFLSLALVEQLQVLESLREREAASGVGVGSVRAMATR